MDYNKDYYSILGVDKKATKKEIASAYKKMMRKWHPDLFASKSKKEQEEANRKSADINEANEVLSDDAKRSEYDTMREYGSYGGMGGGFGGFEHFSSHSDDFQDPMDDFIRSRVGGYAKPRHQPRPNNESRKPVDGRNIGISVELPFEDFFFGCEKTIEVTVDRKCTHCNNGFIGEKADYVKCPDCGGTGMISSRRGNFFMQRTCAHCNGSGWILNNECRECHGVGVVVGGGKQTITFTIPKDTRSSYTQRYSGVGNDGFFGGKTGDIIITANISKAGAFIPVPNASPNTLYTIHYISIFRALGGGIETIYTPYGRKNVMLPSNLADRCEMTFHGCGWKGKNGEPDGDLIVSFRYDIPSSSSIDDKTRKKLSEIADNLDSNEKCFPNVAVERGYMEKYMKRLS